ncbi:MAG: hypothetical protein ACO3BI_01180 [Candidatus Nanopelagicales bacterium]
MKKLLSFTLLVAVAYWVYRTIVGQRETEALWREATGEFDLR